MSLILPNRSATLVLLAMTGIPLAASSAAGQTQPGAERAAENPLPGVESGDGRIVENEPLAEPDRPAEYDGGYGSYRIGDWDVTVSGSVRYEIGVGDARKR